MTAAALPATLLDTLAAFDTPTVCNAMEVVAPERRGCGFTTHAMVVARPQLKPIVGYARTATYRSMTPSDRPPAEMAAQRAAYYAHVEAGNRPTVSVLQDIDPEPGYGAFWGEVNSTIHSSLGCIGGITNGSIRDLDQLAPDFQLIAGKVGPSHAYGHLLEFAGEVEVLGMKVKDGDLIHADRHGAIVIPVEYADALPAAVDLIVRREKIILDTCRRPGFNAEMLKQAMAQAADIH